MHYMNPDGWARVVSVASPLFTSLEESRLLGEATRRAIEQSDQRVAVLASGSLSHRLWPNKQLGPDAWTSVASEFNRQVDLRVLELWQQRRYREFIDMLPDYAIKCNGEGGMADTIMLFAALGWDGYQRRIGAALRVFSLQRQRPGQCRVSRRMIGSAISLPRTAITEDVGDDGCHHQRAADERPGAGTSWNASHIQNGISGVSSVAIRVACPDGSSREPSTNRVRPNATWKNPNAARMPRSVPAYAGYAVGEGNADDAAEPVRQRRRRHH